MKSVLRRVLPERWLRALRKFRNDRFDVYAFKSYSQEGEDMILRRVFEGQLQGFYVDVGAHHPRRFSNTYFYYKRGWSGVNIDGMPGSMNLFMKYRPRDINIECAVGAYTREATYYLFNDPALNSFHETISLERNTDPYHIIGTRQMRVEPLRDILVEHFPNGRSIDFLTIDVEGMEIEVLQSNDWQLFRPRYVLVECLNLALDEFRTDPVNVFLCGMGYRLFAKTVNTAIYQDNDE